MSIVRIFDNITGEKNMFFVRVVLKNPSVERVSGEETQLSPKDFSLSFARACFLPGSICLLLILCADFELGAECLPLGGLWWPRSGLKRRSVSLGFHLIV